MLAAIAGVTLTADVGVGRADQLTNDYFAAKAAAVQETERIRKDKGEEAAAAAQDAALADLAGRLAAIIGPVAVEGFQRDGRNNVESLTRGELGEGSVDGLAFAAAGSDDRLVVSTEALIARWLDANRKDWDPLEKAPRDVAAALKSDAFYTQLAGGDSAVGTFAMLPVRVPSSVQAQARLIDRRQEFFLSAPKELLVTVRRGSRVLIAVAKAAVPVAMIPACAAIWKAYQTKAEAGQGGTTQDGDDARARTDADFRRCFGSRLRQQSYYAPLLQQAQSLVDRMTR